MRTASSDPFVSIFDQVIEVTRERATEAEIERAREDPNAFIEYAFTDEEGEPLKQAWFHREWQKRFPTEPPARVLIEAFRGSGKSTNVIGRLIWEIGRNPNIRIKYVCGIDDTAKKFVNALGRHIQRPDILRVFPDIIPHKPWGEKGLFLKRTIDMIDPDPTVVGCSVTGRYEGGRTDILVLDDICNLENAVISPAEREHVKMAVRRKWIPMLGRGKGRVLLIGTPWHNQDYLSEAKESDTIWDTGGRNYPVYLPDGTPIWPEIFSREVIELIRKTMEGKSTGDRDFRCQYLLEPLTEADKTFPQESWARPCEYGQRLGLVWGSPEYRKFTDPLQKCIGVDLAHALSDRGAYTVIFVIAIDENGVAWPVEIVRRKMKFPEILREIRRVNAVYSTTGPPPDIIVVESNAFQSAVLAELAETDPHLPVVPHVTGQNKADPVAGLPGLSAAMANGALGIPLYGSGRNDVERVLSSMAHRASDDPFLRWIEEMSDHPQAEFSDTVMAFWFAMTGARRYLARGENLNYTVYHDSDLDTPHCRKCGSRLDQQVMVNEMIRVCTNCGSREKFDGPPVLRPRVVDLDVMASLHTSGHGRMPWEV